MKAKNDYKALLAQRKIKERIQKILRPLVHVPTLEHYVEFKSSNNLIRFWRGRGGKINGVVVLALIPTTLQPEEWTETMLYKAKWERSWFNPRSMVIEQAVGNIKTIVKELMENSPTVEQVVWRKRKGGKIKVMNRQQAIDIGQKFIR